MPWREFCENYDLIREKIEAVIPGFENYNERVRKPGGFDLPNGPRQGTFPTPSGKAHFTVVSPTAPQAEPGQLVMMTIRSHDQFNTTIYGMDDRYRGIRKERRVVMMNEKDIAERGLKPGDIVDLVSHFRGETRRANRFLIVKYDLPQGNCATYFPETNVLVPLESTADESRTPTSKSVNITVERANMSTS